MTVGEISNETVTTAADETVIAAAELMDSEGTGALVVEDNGTVEGSLPTVRSRWRLQSTRVIYRISPSRR
jgi:CBS domain-containing protein